MYLNKTNTCCSTPLEKTINNMNSFEQLDWIFPVVIIVFTIIVETWFIISLLHYGIKTKKWKELHNAGNPDKLNSGAIYTALVACAVLSFTYSLISLARINFGFNLGEDELCDSLADASTIAYALTLFAMQMLWWLRQRAFFVNRMLNVNYSKKVRFFSAISIIIIFTAGISALVLNTYSDDYHSSLDGCVYKPDDSLRVGYWISIIIVVLFGQVTFLGLFVYALTQTSGINGGLSTKTVKILCFWNKHCCRLDQSKKTQRENSKSVSDESCDNNTKATPSSNSTSNAFRLHNSNTKITSILRKTLFFAIISILAEVFVQAFIHYITNPNSHRRFSLVVGNINFLLILLFLVFSFVEYREMLSSPCKTL